MCGIFGIVSRAGPVRRTAAARAAARLTHRGPDDAGSWLSPDGAVCLAHRRLAVLDLSAAGHQPMTAPSGHALCYNGEIYNYRQLKTELEGLGYTFHGSGDTEVVLAAYQAWGEACVTRFNGMFALAVYDPESGGGPSLFLARDRGGEKPLYYRLDGGAFAFASEPKAFEPGAPVDPDALNHYLATGSLPPDRGLFQGIYKLPPAHTARLTLKDFRLSVRRYWQLPVANPSRDADADELTEELERLLIDAVRIRLASDVPLGVLLSGGLDSSLVLAAAARAAQEPMHAFTMAVPGTPLDEGPQARRLAAHFGAKHEVLTLDTPSLDVLHRIAPLVDEPLGDSSLIPAFLVSELTRKRVTVALGGDGGDELFGGYPVYARVATDARRMAAVPRALLAGAAQAAALLPAGVRGRNRVQSLRAGAAMQGAWSTPYFDPELRRRLLTDDARCALQAPVDEPERAREALLTNGAGPVDCMTRADFSTTLAEDFLVKVDRASMAHSLELRTPYLDPRLIEFAFACVPESLKVRGQATRLIQRRLARRMLPEDADFSRKQGFSIPLDQWLRADRCQWVYDTLPDLPDAIRPQAVRDLIDGHMRGRANGARLFALIMLALACRNSRVERPL